MPPFIRLATILEKHESRSLDVEALSRELGFLLEQSSAVEARALACLATGRLGSPHSERIPWRGMTAERLVARLRQGRQNDTHSYEDAVDIIAVYDTLHKMDPVRPDWYPDRLGTAEKLLSMAARFGEIEIKWLVNLMLGKNLLRKGLVLRSAVEAAGGTANDLGLLSLRMNKSVPNIGLVVEYIRADGLTLTKNRLKDIHYGTPVPLEEMDSLNSHQVDRALDQLRARGRTAYVQAKSDGVYVQVQKDRDAIFLFDELGVDLAGLPALFIGSAVPRALRPADAQRYRMASRVSDLIEMIKGIAADRIILDAELVGIDPDGKSVIAKSKTFEAKAMQLIVFDIIANDTDLRHLSYAERRDHMIDLLGTTSPEYAPGIYVAEEVSATGAIGVAAHMEAFLSRNRYEGVVLKNPGARLTSGLRWNSKRIKIKKYTTLDMLLVGFFYNAEKTKPTKYLMALRDEKTDRYLPCAITVAQGDVEEEINQYCLDTATTTCPSDVVCEGSPDLWTETRLVVEVESDGLIVRNSDPRFRSVPWTLHQNQQRKIIGVRWDKPEDRVNTLERLFSLERAPGH